MSRPDWWRWSWFSPQEVLSSYGLELLGRGVMPLQFRALDHLQGFREYLNVPLVVNTSNMEYRGYRSVEEHMSVSDTPHSFHVAGLAFDLHSPELSVEELYEHALGFGWRGIGRYEGFLHLDMRDGDPSEWSE